MKILFFYSLLLIFSSVSLFGQGHLRVSSISGLPPDTVFEAGSYNVDVTIVNDSTVTYTDSIQIRIQGDSMGSDILIPFTAVSILPSDSVTLQRVGYVFSPQYFEEGDNIVVVWPVAAAVPVTYDPISFNLNFVSMAANTGNVAIESFYIYPNPASKFISINGLTGIKIKQVRIYDVSGKLIYQKSSLQKFISVEDWPPGLYIIQLENEDGFIRNIKLQKN